MMKLALGLIASLVISVTIHIYYGYTMTRATMGIFNIESACNSIGIAVALFSGSVSGVISSVVLKRYAKQCSLLQLFDRKTLVFALAISPVIVGAFYDKISALNSPWLVFVLAHQNGYFWESMSAFAAREHA